MKMVDVVEEGESLNRILAYSIACPRAVRPLSAQMREFGMEEQANEMIDKVNIKAMYIWLRNDAYIPRLARKWQNR